ncbi:MAG TPA: sigma-70 family RNA polymerase sigma factor [Candidatus Eisenbacteria bacterium]|nr:sigma-70 family RNA polymerase sigma factor [Candidatus Eisenbacteria bacterium]
MSETMLSAAISDRECIERLQQGETGAFEILVRRHQKTIFNLVYRLLGDYDEAAEIAQEAFLSAYKSVAQFRGDANFSTWLYRIAINHASTRRKNLVSAQQRNVPLETTDPIDERRPDPADSLERKEIQERVQKALNTLEPNDAAIILLRDMQDMPYDEVARMLELPVGTVKSRLYRARQALKSRLAPYFYAGRNGK